MRCRFFPVFISVIVFSMSIGCLDMATDPYSKDQADISLMLMSSDYHESDTAVIDTVGRNVRVKLCLYLTQYIDSVVIDISSSSRKDTIIRCGKKDRMIDTLSNNVSFSQAGDRTVTATAYLGGDRRQAVATIHIIGGRNAEIASYMVMDIRDTSALRWMSDDLPDDGNDTSGLIVCNDTAFIRIVTAARVHSVTFAETVLSQGDSSGTVFEYKRAYLPVAGNNVFPIKVIAEDRMTTGTCTLTVPSSLRPVVVPRIVPPASGTFRSLTAQCGIDGDSRVTYVVVVRAEHPISEVAFSTTALPVEKSTLPDDSTVTVAQILDAPANLDFIDDSLKPNTTYYYRFITSGGSAGNFFYGEGREASSTTKGKISISATVTVTATLVSDGTSDYDWEMFGAIAFCGKTMWSAPEAAYTMVTEGTTTGPLGAVVDTCAPDNDSCSVSFSLADYDASSGNDVIGSLGTTTITYPVILGTYKLTAGQYSFTTVKTYGFSDASGSGSVNYTFKCEYID